MHACPECGKTMATAGGLEIHMEISHPSEPGASRRAPVAAASYERQVSEVVESDEDVSDYVHRLEESSDDGEDDELELPTGDELGAEFERFLREQGD